MEINDIYHERFQDWVRDLRDVGYEKEERRNIIESNVYFGDNLRNPRSNKLSNYSSAAIVMGMAGAGWPAPFVLHGRGPSYLLPIMITSAVIFAGGIATKLFTAFMDKRNRERMCKIKNTANNQRYAREHGRFPRGNRQFTLESL